MQMNKLKKQNTVRCASFLAVVFVSVCVLTAMTPLVADDFNYAFTWANPYRRVVSFADLVASMRSHRNLTHGRVFAQGWVMLFMMGPKWFFSIANATVITSLFAGLIHYCSRIRMERPIAVVAGISAIYWICMPAFGQVFLWLDGACNYIWGAALAWVLIEATASLKHGLKWNVAFILLLPFAFVVGAWSEHISFACLVIQFLFLVWRWIRHKKIPIRECLLLFAGGGGYLFLIFAPSVLGKNIGNRTRFTIDKQHILTMLTRYWWIVLIVLVLLFCLWRFAKQVQNRRKIVIIALSAAIIICSLSFIYFGIKELVTGGFYKLISSSATGFLLMCSMFLISLHQAVVQRSEREVIMEAAILCVGGLSALLPFVVALYIPARGLCAPVVFMGIATARLWSSLKIEHNKQICTLLAVAFAICFVCGVADIATVFNASQKRLKAIAEAQAGNGVLVTAPYPVKTKYSAQYGLADLTQGESWPNDTVKIYYGLKEIIVRNG